MTMERTSLEQIANEIDQTLNNDYATPSLETDMWQVALQKCALLAENGLQHGGGQAVQFDTPAEIKIDAVVEDGTETLPLDGSKKAEPKEKKSKRLGAPR